MHDLKNHLPTASVFKCDFSYRCAAINKISPDISHRAIPLTGKLLVIDRIYSWKEYVVEAFIGAKKTGQR